MGVKQETFTVPSNPDDRKALKKSIDAITDSMTRMDGEKEYQKESFKELSEKYDIPQKYLRQMAVDAHKDKFKKKVDEMDAYSELYETIMEMTN